MKTFEELTNECRQKSGILYRCLPMYAQLMSQWHLSPTGFNSGFHYINLPEHAAERFEQARNENDVSTMEAIIRYQRDPDGVFEFSIMGAWSTCQTKPPMWVSGHKYRYAPKVVDSPELKHAKKLLSIGENSVKHVTAMYTRRKASVDAIEAFLAGTVGQLECQTRLSREADWTPTTEVRDPRIYNHRFVDKPKRAALPDGTIRAGAVLTNREACYITLRHIEGANYRFSDSSTKTLSTIAEEGWKYKNPGTTEYKDAFQCNTMRC